MAVIRRKRRSLHDDLELAIRALNDQKVINDLERRCIQVERDYTELRKRIISFLSNDQIDAAKTCGCTPEVYALEWFEICRQTMRDHTPSFANINQPLPLVGREFKGKGY
jgi:hypothetical protein